MQNNEALMEVINDHEKLIYSIVNKIKSHHDYDDLFQVGVIGLIKAYRNYDQSYGTKFSTYAFPYILGEIKKFVREDRGIKISRDLFRLSDQIERARDLLAQKLMRVPSISELAIYLEIDEDKINEALNIHTYIQSLDVPVNDEGKELTLYDSISVTEPIDLLDKLYLKELIISLPTADQQLIYMRYEKDRTQNEIANTLGLTQVQVSRQEQKVLTRLKKSMLGK
ncbi:MAG: sigma-70 family RNA polymerase sigma factor [Bacilli bacterium]|jgi:RNA polymerase sporulation-specific sigma factor